MKNNQYNINLERDVNVHFEDKKKSRIFFVFLWILYAVVYMTKNSFNGALASIVEEGILTKSQTGLITAMFYLAYTPLQIVGGFVSDKFSPERLIKIGLVGAAISNTIIFFNQNYYVMLFSWMFNGMVQFGIWPSIFKIISSQLVRSDRAKMVFYITFCAPIGLILTYFTAAIMPHWKYNFALSSICMVVFAVLMHIFEIKMNPFLKWDKMEQEDKNTECEHIQVPTMKLFAKSGFFFMMIGLCIATIAIQSRASTATVMFLENYENVSASVSNLLNIFMLVSGIVGTLVAGKIVKKMKNEIAGMAIVFLCMLPFFALCFFAGKVPVPMLIVFHCAIACLESVTNLVRNYYNLNFVKYGKSGLAAGVLNAGLSFSFMMAAWVMMRVVDNYGWLVMVAAWCALVVAGIIITAIGIPMLKKFKKNGIE